MFLFPHTLILLKGAGDLGTGVAWRLHKAGFSIIIAELAQPLCVRRTVSFASAVYEGAISVEGVTARRAESFDHARACLNDGVIPVLIDPATRAREFFSPQVLIDAVMAKRNTGTRITDARLVIALGPGFTPQVDCHAIIETNRGHYLGRVDWERAAEKNTGVPGEINGKSAERVLRAPIAGRVQNVREIGERVVAGDVIARVENEKVIAPFDGIVRGLIHDGLSVEQGMKIGDVDARAQREHCFTISDKARAVGGGALEAILFWLRTHSAE